MVREAREQKRMCYGRIVCYSQMTTNCHIPIMVGCINSSILHSPAEEPFVIRSFYHKTFLKEKNLSKYLSFKFGSEIPGCSTCIGASAKEFLCNVNTVYYMSLTYFITRLLREYVRSSALTKNK